MTDPRTPNTISVVIPTCDRPLPLHRALSSVARQTRRPNEVIVVDNGTTRLPENRFEDGVRVVAAPKRAGASQARNIGAVVATSDFVAFLDDDDTWEHDYLEEMENHFGGGTLVLVGALHDAGSGEPLIGKNRSRMGPPSVWYQRNYGLGGSNLVIARALFLDLGGFDPKLWAAEDVDLAIRLLEAGQELVRIPDAVARCDVAITSDSLSTFRSLMAARRVFLRKHLGNPLIRWLLLLEYAVRLSAARARSAFRAPPRSP